MVRAQETSKSSEAMIPYRSGSTRRLLRRSPHWCLTLHPNNHQRGARTRRTLIRGNSKRQPIPAYYDPIRRKNVEYKSIGTEEEFIACFSKAPAGYPSHGSWNPGVGRSCFKQATRWGGVACPPLQLRERYCIARLHSTASPEVMSALLLLGQGCYAGEVYNLSENWRSPLRVLHSEVSYHQSGLSLYPDSMRALLIPHSIHRK